MKFKVIIIMLTTMFFMGCDIFGPSCEDLQAELITATETLAASAVLLMAGETSTVSDDCDAMVAKMQEYIDKGCGEEEGGYVYTDADVSAAQIGCTLYAEMEALLDDTATD